MYSIFVEDFALENCTDLSALDWVSLHTQQYQTFGEGISTPHLQTPHFIKSCSRERETCCAPVVMSILQWSFLTPLKSILYYGFGQ
jgi:hypothetical protein